MHRRSPRLNTVVTLCLLGMGAVGLALVLFSSGIYRSLAHDNRASAAQERLRHEVASRRSAAIAADRVFALDLAAGTEFRSAWQARSPGALEALLSDALTALPADRALLGVHVLDRSGSTIASAGRIGCREALASTASRGFGTRTCLHGDMPARSTVVPLRGIQPEGFIEVVGDPLATLARIGESDGLGLRIERPGGELLFESDGWRRADSGQGSGQDRVMVDYLTPSSTSDEPVFAMRAAVDVSLLNRQLGNTRDFVLLAAGSILALVLLGALVSLRRLMWPLRALQQAAEGVSQDRGIDDFTAVAETGPPEIATPIRSFNGMVERVRALVGELEGEVGQRRDAERLAQRAREQAENHARNASQAREFSHATLEAVIDAVVATDPDGRIEYMNPVAEALIGVAEGDVLGQSIDSVVTIHDRAGHSLGSGLVEQCLDDGSAAERRVGRLGTPQQGVEPCYVDYAVVAMRDSNGTIVGAVLIFHDVTDAEHMTKRLHYQATHDALSGLINRYEFENRLQGVLDRTQEGLETAVLCYLDLDQFKLVNDTCGHVAGDEMLRQLSLMLVERLAGRGTLGRLGGDEFGLLLQPCTIAEARDVAEKVRAAIHRFRFVWEEHVFSIGVSIGVVAIDRNSPGTEMLLSAADTACYMAKDCGRNRVQVYEQDDAALQERHAEMHWVSEINRALEADRFMLYCQDIVAVMTPDPVRHYEILLRMRDEQGRIWSPGSFLPAAERYNLAPAIDQWVVNQAFGWIAATGVPADGLYSINLSGRSLAADGFLETVLRELDRHDVSPGNICFEVTETAAIANLGSARAFIEALRARGCRFSLDDFGSGLSSFSYLQNLPVDFLKIDGAFVADLPDNAVHQSIVRSMNDIGHAMGMHTIAEFAENQAVIDCLHGIGVDYIQGYGYARPKPLHAPPPSATEALHT